MTEKRILYVTFKVIYFPKFLLSNTVQLNENSKLLKRSFETASSLNTVQLNNTTDRNDVSISNSGLTQRATVKGANLTASTGA
jgi:hypothetical protein